MVSRWATGSSHYCSLSPRVIATVVRRRCSIDDIRQWRRCRASYGDLCSAGISACVHGLRDIGSERRRDDFSPFPSHGELTALFVGACSTGYYLELVSRHDHFSRFPHTSHTVFHLRPTLVSTDERRWHELAVDPTLGRHLSLGLATGLGEHFECAQWSLWPVGERKGEVLENVAFI